MNKYSKRASGIFILVLITLNTFCQNSDSLNRGLTRELGPLFLIDGLPLYTMDELNKIDPQKLASINLDMDTLFDCSGVAIYRGLIKVTSKDSLNAGLKYILKQTNNWIITHPLAEFKVNGLSVSNSELIHKLYLIQPAEIKSIKVIEPRKKTKCDNGFLIIKTNK
jgi:hypothetical protein